MKSNTYNVSSNLDPASFIPLSILRNRKLAVLEAIVQFLKDEKYISFHTIAILTNRNDRTIWTAYSRAHKKSQDEFEIDYNFNLPLSVLKDRSVSIFETIVEYLHEARNLSFKEIAVLLNRDERTIWTVYSRVRKKRARQLR